MGEEAQEQEADNLSDLAIVDKVVSLQAHMAVPTGAFQRPARMSQSQKREHHK
jgi:hypothetical protein